jgi:hypothetical protein
VLCGGRYIAHLQFIDLADHLVYRTEAELGHNFTNFLSDKVHEVDNRIGSATKLFPKQRILSGYADRASILVANPHH